MRYLLVLIPIVFISCSPFGFNPMGYEVLHEDLDTAWKKVSAMEYVPDITPANKSPHDFFIDGYGDCEDFAIAMVYLLGPEAELVFIDHPETNGHSIVSYRGEYLEPQIYGKRIDRAEIIIQNTFTYNYIMCLATYWGTKHI